jgi:hypothetical protein
MNPSTASKNTYDSKAALRDIKLSMMVSALDDAGRLLSDMWEAMPIDNDSGIHSSEVEDAIRGIQTIADYLEDLRLSHHKISR